MSSTNITVKILKLRSSDGELFDLEEDIAVRCVTIKNLVEDSCGDGEIPVLNVDGRTLAMVLSYCKKHADKNLKEDELRNWKNAFLENMSIKDDLYDVLIASDYLQEEDLLSSCCARVADLIRGKSPQEIRDLFGIENDFTPEEIDKIQRDHAWVFQ